MLLAAGMSPAWQQILEFDEVHVGRVNRAARATWCASGKVLNVARALQLLGAPARTICIAGGDTGRSIRDEFARDGIPAEWIDAGAPTRVCTTILDRASGETTELVENATPCPPDVFERFARAFASAAERSPYLIFTGSLPPNAPAGFTHSLLASAGESRAILDIRGPELLEALPLRPFLVKPNRHELGLTVGRELPDDASLLAAMREINGRGATWVVVSDGSRALWATSSRQSFRIQPPTVKVVNPIGCGDCLTAGLADALARKREFADALAWGVAAAAANAERLRPADFEPERAVELQELVTIEHLPLPQ